MSSPLKPQPRGETLAVELRHLTKSFGEVRANSQVNLRVQRGTIHGIIGENGAGKSTAMNLLFGLYRPDSGEIFINAEPCQWNSPSDAIRHGLGMVHQHFMLAGPYSALDNLLLGSAAGPLGWLNRRQAQRELESLAANYGMAVDWQRCVEDLPVGIQQRIEILKLLYRQAQILILDEPTAVLVPEEANTLFTHLRQLRDKGKTILLVTHKLKEVMAVTDRVTVFRGGKVTGELETSKTNPQELASLMVGRKVVLGLDVPPAHARAEPALEVQNLNLAGPVGSRHRLSNVSFCVRRSEILGIAGVEGNGQSELVFALLEPANPLCATSGTVKMLDKDVTHWSAAKIRDLGVAVIPEDRLRQGLLPERPLDENFLLGLHRSASFNRGGWLSTTSLNQAAARALAEYDVRPANLDMPAGKLSGGNQQKLVLAREFERRPRLIIAAQPTRGVDVGAIEFIHGRLVAARDQGAGVLLISSELDEVLRLSDRILVMYEGQIAAEFKRGQATEHQLGLKMGGA